MRQQSEPSGGGCGREPKSTHLVSLWRQVVMSEQLRPRLLHAHGNAVAGFGVPPQLDCPALNHVQRFLRQQLEGLARLVKVSDIAEVDAVGGVSAVADGAAAIAVGTPGERVVPLRRVMARAGRQRRVEGVAGVLQQCALVLRECRFLARRRESVCGGERLKVLFSALRDERNEDSCVRLVAVGSAVCSASAYEPCKGHTGGFGTRLVKAANLDQSGSASSSASSRSTRAAVGRSSSIQGLWRWQLSE